MWRMYIHVRNMYMYMYIHLTYGTVSMSIDSSYLLSMVCHTCMHKVCGGEGEREGAPALRGSNGFLR